MNYDGIQDAETGNDKKMTKEATEQWRKDEEHQKNKDKLQ